MESSLATPEVTKPSPAYIAPWWHTALLVLFMLVFSALGSKGHPGLNHSLRLELYSSTIVLEWLMVLFIYWGLPLRKQTTLGELIGGKWKTPEDFLLDVAVAVGFYLVAALVLVAVGYALGLGGTGNVGEVEKRIGAMLPVGRSEIVTFLALCATAGFCEEVIFRGYLQKQFTVLCRWAWGGIIAQALIFGGSHAYEGWQKMVQIGVFGFLFGVLAYWRKSLRPGMMTHFAQDSIVGLFARWALDHAAKVLPK